MGIIKTMLETLRNLSEESRKSNRQMLDRPMPIPPNPSRNTSSNIDKDIKCSYPSCNDFASIKCGFCKLHCERLHKGIHYKKILQTDIPDLVAKYLELKKDDTLTCELENRYGENIVIIKKKKRTERDHIADMIEEALRNWKDINKKIDNDK